jgi:hypothetical protein
MLAELVVPGQVENWGVLEDPKLRCPGCEGTLFVLPVVAIQRNIPALDVAGGILNAIRTIFVVDLSAYDNCATAIAAGVLAGSYSNGMVLIILVGDLIAGKHVMGVQGNKQNGDMKYGEVWRGGYSCGIGNDFKWAGTKFWVCTGAHGF